MIVPMFSVYFGNDAIAVRSALLKKTGTAAEGGVVVTQIDGDTYTPGIFADAVGGTSLFGEAMLFVVDAASAKTDFKAELTESLEALKDSLHEFIILEGALLAPDKKQYAKFAAGMEEFKAAAAERYNVFAMADSLAKKDKKMLWMQLMEAQSAGLSAEEIIGTLWWQLKSLRLAALTKSAEEAGMKDFSYQKSKRALGAFKPRELERLSTSLLAVYHDGHGGVRDIDVALEKWVLTI
jgi:hypothetical protein